MCRRTTTRITASSRWRTPRFSRTTRCMRGCRSTSAPRTSLRWRESSESARRRSTRFRRSRSARSASRRSRWRLLTRRLLPAASTRSRWRSRRSFYSNGQADTSGVWGKPQRERVIPDWVASTVTQVLEQNMLYGTGTRRARLQPHRRRQVGHDGQLRRCVVQRLHAAARRRPCGSAIRRRRLRC